MKNPGAPTSSPPQAGPAGAAAHGATGGLTGGMAAGQPLAPINILIVDDEPRNLVVLETVLDDPGYRLVRAETADRALLALVEQEFALLILDIQMPVMTGFELAQLIKQRKKTAQVPIIFLTAYYNEDQHMLEGYGSGAVDYLLKPVNPVILRSKVAIFAELHRKNNELAVANRALLTEVGERREAQQQLRELNETLERRVAERTEALTERTKVEKAAREQLRASEELNRSLMDGTADCVQVLDLDGRLLHINRPGLALLELGDFEPYNGMHWRALWPDAAHAAVDSAIVRALAGESSSFVAPRPTSAGDLMWWSVLVSPVRHPVNGRLARLLAVSRDVTEARRAEQALREADERKDAFIATLSHELRNPLAPMRNAINLMRGDNLSDADFAWCRDVIDRQLQQMARLLEDLLDVSRITRAKLTLRRERVEMSAVIEQAVETARPVINEAHHTLSVAPPRAPLILMGDSARLAQVVSNLLINAAKFTPAGGRIELTVEHAEGEVTLRVRDNGIGIARDQLPHIFQVFGQVPSAQARSQGGLGIGLSLARGLVELHGGTLTVNSDGPGKGSEFIMRLPAAARPADALPPASAPVEAAAHFRILVADDLRDSADSLGLLLKAMGNEVCIVYGGAQAVEAAGTFRPDLVFLDLGMPEVDGYEACRRIRSAPGGGRVVIIAQTGWGQEQDRRRTNEAGFDHHMVKPIDGQALEALLARIGTPADAAKS
ncbi:MAG TPA: response regulator [Burkholderiales bacterium]|nr:response regulator [Burkholderiales bacterium]